VLDEGGVLVLAQVEVAVDLTAWTDNSAPEHAIIAREDAQPTREVVANPQLGGGHQRCDMRLPEANVAGFGEQPIGDGQAGTAALVRAAVNIDGLIGDSQGDFGGRIQETVVVLPAEPAANLVPEKLITR